MLQPSGVGGMARGSLRNLPTLLVQMSPRIEVELLLVQLMLEQEEFDIGFGSNFTRTASDGRREAGCGYTIRCQCGIVDIQAGGMSTDAIGRPVRAMGAGAPHRTGRVLGD